MTMIAAAVTPEALCLGLDPSVCARHPCDTCPHNLRQERERNHRLFDLTLTGESHVLGFCVTGPHVLRVE